MTLPRLSCWVTLACAFSLTGCTSYIAHQIVEAPNKLQTPAEKQPKLAAFINQIRDQDFSRTAMVPVGPPPAELSIAVVPPGNAGMEYNAKITQHRAEVQFKPGKLQRYSGNPKATIVLLPTFQNGKFMMLPWAFTLTQQGYQCVLVDLRGEGLSTGDWVTWGNVESRDVQQLTRWLNSRNIVAGPLVLVGVSYGASVALRAAALDSQVKAVGAIEPFVNAVDVIKRGGRITHPRLSLFISDASMDAAIHEADILADTRLENASTLPAVRALSVPVLYIYGAEDRFIPEKEAQQLAANTRNARYISIAGVNHLSLPFAMQKYQQQVLDWLTQVLHGNPQ